MTKSLLRLTLSMMAAGAILGTALPVFAGDDGDALKKAEDLVKQAWNPGGDPPSSDQRTQWLTQAIDLAKGEPDHRLRGMRVEAIRLMQQALDMLKAGDADNSKISDVLQSADRDLRTAMERAESR